MADKPDEVLSEAEQKELEAEKERERQEALRAEGGKRYDGGEIPKK
jgi:hypothetical protein